MEGRMGYFREAFSLNTPLPYIVGAVAAAAYIWVGFRESKRYWRWAAEEREPRLWPFPASIAPVLWPLFRLIEGIGKAGWLLAYPWRKIARDAEMEVEVPMAEKRLLDAMTNYPTCSNKAEFEHLWDVRKKYGLQLPTKLEYGLDEEFHVVKIKPKPVVQVPISVVDSVAVVPRDFVLPDRTGTIFPSGHIDLTKKLGDMSAAEWYHLQDCVECWSKRGGIRPPMPGLGAGCDVGGIW